MSTEPAINPWAEFRRRWRPLHKTIALWAFSWLMLFSKQLEQAWIATTLILLAVAVLCLWRHGHLKSPRGDQLFYWSPRRQYRQARRLHCWLFVYVPEKIPRVSSRQVLHSGRASQRRGAGGPP